MCFNIIKYKSLIYLGNNYILYNYIYIRKNKVIKINFITSISYNSYEAK